MRTDRELLEDALHILDKDQWIHPKSTLHDEIRARLAEPEDEPVLWIRPNGIHLSHTKVEGYLPLYRHPRQPVRLSDEEIENLFEENPIGKYPRIAIARAIEKAVLKKNHE